MREKKKEGGGGTRGLCFGENRSLGAGVENSIGDRGRALEAALVPQPGTSELRRGVWVCSDHQTEILN